ncbi:MAG: hybrid sensor histidine kinase/response regulator [Desulfobacterales bacterium]|nr:hybrid sensor histidine kinase/response regulator [Desulfobacterales bacterium]
MTEKSILLVDDEEGIRKVLSIALSDLGYQVHSAANGVEALRVFKAKQPPIVLTDIKMPEMDGIELLRRLKKISPDTEIIMITGHGDMGLAIKSVKYEATDFVTKPINDEVLEIALNRAAERIEMRRKLNEYTQNLEQLVKEKTQQLVEAERLAAVGQTVAGLSHAIKNITGGLKGGAFVLEKGIELNDQKYLMQGWEMIKGNVDKITNLSLDLLNYAKATDLNIEAGDPREPAQEVIDLMRPRAQELGIELVSEFAADLPECDFDTDLICRCLLNLVSNAIDACRNNDPDELGKTVTVRAQKRRGWGVEYQVLDNGCGMTAKTKRKLFQRFFSTKGSEGTGIGLMISKKIVDAHQGIIKVESQEDVGSTFFIKLPKKPNG